jgi:hypothetical protein
MDINLEKNQMLLFSHYVAEIEGFYDYSPEFIADQKSEDYRIIYGLAGYNFSGVMISSLMVL